MFSQSQALEKQDLPARKYMTSAQLRHDVRAFIHQNFMNKDLDVFLVARAMNCSVRNIYRVFKTEEMSASRYLWHVRLEHSKVLLKDKTWIGHGIAQIAHASGFSSIAHYSRIFKATYGCCPSQYRRDTNMI